MGKRKKKQGKSFGGKVISYTGKLVFEYKVTHQVVVSKESVSRVEKVYNSMKDDYEVRVIMKNGEYYVTHERYETELLNFYKEKVQNERCRIKNQR